VGPTGTGTSGGWIQHQFLIADFLAPTSNMRLRFRTGDNGGGSIVEAAIDDIQILDLVCDVNVSNVTPNSGPAGGGTVVYITGEGFVDGLTSVLFGDQPAASTVVVNSTRLRVRAPGVGGNGRRSLRRQTVDITVTTGPGSATQAGAFTYNGGF